jgi:hypothetical protein
MTMSVWIQTSPSGCRRPLGEQQEFFHLAPDPLGGQIVERDRFQERSSRLVNREIESGRELQGAQDTQAVVAEPLWIDHSEAARAKVVLPVEGIDDVVRQRIAGDCVDREIPPPRRVLRRKRRVALDRKALVPAPGLRLAAGQRHVDAVDLEDRETFADLIHASERFKERAQRIGRHAEDFDVEIFRLAAEQLVSNRAAHDQRAPATRGDRSGQGAQRLSRRRL